MAYTEYLIYTSISLIFRRRKYSLKILPWRMIYLRLWITVIIVIIWIFRKWDVGVWVGSIWLRIGTGGGQLSMQ